MFGSLPSSLKILELINCESIIDNNLKLLKQLSNLTHLTIKDSAKITGSTFGNLPSSLKTLELIKCENITYESVTNLAKSKLLDDTQLHIECCLRFENKTFIMKKLRTIVAEKRQTFNSRLSPV
jgi:hypothetical protein